MKKTETEAQVIDTEATANESEQKTNKFVGFIKRNAKKIVVGTVITALTGVVSYKLGENHAYDEFADYNVDVNLNILPEVSETEPEEGE